jgi:citrate synthase
VLDYFLEDAAKKNLFEGITARWISFQGAPILELQGKYTSLTACHVLSRDEKPKDSENGYRKNNRAKNQKNLRRVFKIKKVEPARDQNGLWLQFSA